MGYEFVAPLPVGIECSSAVASALPRELPLSAIENSHQRMTFRWSDTPERKSCPEDVELHFDVGTVIVNFRSGDRQRRQAVLSVVASAISTVVGSCVAFEEL